MLSTLIKKQFAECFRSYYINKKTGEARSKGKTVGLFVLFGLLMVYVAGIFFGMSYLVGDMLIPAGFTWLFYSIMGTTAVMLGAFGSVFNTFSYLYLAKDNDLLLSMPIPPSTVLLSRITLVYGMGLLYSAIVWIPTLVYSWIFASLSPTAIVFGILLLFVIAAFVTVLTCALGWVVAIITVRLKNKNIFTVILSILFLGAYFYLSSRMSDIITLMTANAETFGGKLKTWGNFIYQLGHAADGNVLSMVIFTLVTAALAALCIFILSKTFIKIVTISPNTASSPTAKAAAEKPRSVRSALFMRELKRFTSSSLYMLNCGLGVVFLPALGIFALFKKNSLDEMLAAFGTLIPNLTSLLPFAVILVVCLILSINVISTPSISLEGKNLWILRSLPVSGSDVLSAKMLLHLLLNTVPALISVVLFSVCFGLDVTYIVMCAAFVYLYIYLTGALGLIIGLKRPNFAWTSETYPIKQSINVLFSMLIGWGLTVAVCVGAYFLSKVAEVQTILLILIIVFAVAVRFVQRWLTTRGGEIFDRL